ncbi:MAG: hypothetical protein AAFY25_11790 [Pseudomonadota bacterium]
MDLILSGPFLATLTLFVVSTGAGMIQVVKVIQIREAKHELKQGSAGFLRSIGGWSVIFIWFGAVWFLATIIGDWGVSGDLAGAWDRGQLRLRILLEILAALAESDG